MPTETFIKDKAKLEFEKRKWIWWFPIKSRWGGEKDIFGVYDCICVGKEKKKIKLFFIQLTTAKNIRARIKKVEKFLNELIKKGLYLPASSQVWGWEYNKKQFRIYVF